jgi:hypothetical protein
VSLLPNGAKDPKLVSINGFFGFVLEEAVNYRFAAIKLIENRF